MVFVFVVSMLIFMLVVWGIEVVFGWLKWFYVIIKYLVVWFGFFVDVMSCFFNREFWLCFI